MSEHSTDRHARLSDPSLTFAAKGKLAVTMVAPSSRQELQRSWRKQTTWRIQSRAELDWLERSKPEGFRVYSSNAQRGGKLHGRTGALHSYRRKASGAYSRCAW